MSRTLLSPPSATAQRLPLLAAGCRSLLPALALVLTAGCMASGGSAPRNGSINPDPSDRFVFPGEELQAPVTVGVTNTPSQTNAAPPPLPFSSPFRSAALRIGEKITVTFSDLPNAVPPHDQNIREDGTITLPYGVVLQAAGKTPGQLEDEIREAYVPNIYKRLTPIVTADERNFSVGGEVKISNRQRYTDRITVLRAIQAAGDFTDFADRRKIELIRANGQKLVIDWYKAKENPTLDVEVFPGDQIIVGKRIW